MFGMPKIGEIFKKGSKGEEKEAGPTEREKLDQLRAFVSQRTNEWHGGPAVDAPRKPYYPEGVSAVTFLEALREAGVGQPEELKKIFDTMIENAHQSNDPDLQGDIEEMEKLRGYLDDLDKSSISHF